MRTKRVRLMMLALMTAAGALGAGISTGVCVSGFIMGFKISWFASAAAERLRGQSYALSVNLRKRTFGLTEPDDRKDHANGRRDDEHGDQDVDPSVGARRPASRR